MFVTSSQQVKSGLAALLFMSITVSAMAADRIAPVNTKPIPVTIDLLNVQYSSGPIYLSVQARDQYRSSKGYGAVIKDAIPGLMQHTINIDRSGEYAISIWHDTNNDGRYSMDSNTWQILDGWGASGNVPQNKTFGFDDVKIAIPDYGATIAIEIKYPS